jgi:small nuclear ribonucleoprotein (snRNP)-like protein
LAAQEKKPMKETLLNLVKQQVVVDTRSPWVYIGTLADVRPDCLLLANVDVHDSGETSIPKERYVLDSCKTGITPNRRSVYVNLEYVVSVSLLTDVIKF